MTSASDVQVCLRLTQQANSDISGIGIRASFYLQNFLLVLLVNRSWEDAPSALWTFIATNLGLTISALAQTQANASPGLSLYEAIQVSNLVWLANFGTLLSLASYSRQKRYKNHKRNEARLPQRDTIVKLGAVLQAFLSMILTLVMWIKAPTFGAVPQCNEKLRFVILFAVDVNASTTGRIIGLTCTSVITLFFVVTTVHELMLAANRRMPIIGILRIPAFHLCRKQENNASQPNNTVGNTEKTAIEQVLSFVSSPIIEEPAGYGGSALEHPNLETQRQKAHTRVDSSRPRPTLHSTLRSTTMSSYLSRETSGRRRWIHALDGTLIGTIIFQLIVFAYFISVNELYIVRNPTDSGNDVWGFGQIFPLIVVIPAVVSVVQAFQKHGLSHLDRRERSLRVRSKNSTTEKRRATNPRSTEIRKFSR